MSRSSSYLSDDDLCIDEEEEMRRLSDRPAARRRRYNSSEQERVFQAWALLSLQYMSTCYKAMSDELLSCPHQRGSCCCYRRHYNTNKTRAARRLFSPTGPPPPTSVSGYANVAYSRDSGIDDSLTVTSAGDDDSVIEDDMLSSAENTMARVRPVCTSTPSGDNKENNYTHARAHNTHTQQQNKIVDGPILTSLQRRIKQQQDVAKSHDVIHDKETGAYAHGHVETAAGHNQLELYDKYKTRSATDPDIKLLKYELSPPALVSAPDHGKELARVYTSHDTVSRVWLGNDVLETKYVTTVFEGLKLDGLLRDVQDEMKQWIADTGLVIACELVWSFPLETRQKDQEMRLKDALLKCLRHSNRRVLDLQHDASKPDNEPMLMPDARTNEVAGVDTAKQCYQGVYRRSYKGLLGAQHSETAPVHAPYWQLSADAADAKPSPEQFMYGNNRRPSELRSKCLVALNVITLTLGKAKRRAAKLTKTSSRKA